MFLRASQHTQFRALLSPKYRGIYSGWSIRVSNSGIRFHLGALSFGSQFRVRHGHTESKAELAPQNALKGSLSSNASKLIGLAFAVALAAYWGLRENTPPIFAEETQVGEKEFITLEEVNKHNTRDSCWVIVGDKVYDVTNFLEIHPGGANIIVRHAGTDVSTIFNAIHSPSALKMLSPEQCIGSVDVSLLPSRNAGMEEEKRISLARELLPLVAVVNLHDFEAAASKILSGTAWAYYSSAAEEGASHDNNLKAFKRYGFRPRVMRPVGTIDMKSSMLGIATAMPIFVSPAALAGLGHPEGELNITRAAGKAGIIQGISSNATRSVEDIAKARVPNQPLFFQLYVNSNREVSERVVRLVDKLGFRGIMLTVDTPVLGKREKDIRMHLPTRDTDEDIPRTGILVSPDSFLDANLQWSDIAWLKSITNLPIIIKGVQTVEDVELAVENGAAAVLLSNHGGRQLDYAPAAIDVLYELRQRRPDLFERAEIYIDGGVRRGSDVIKALALGARGVGLGRPFLYSNVYGERGVTRAIHILEEEMSRTMRMLGATKISELVPEMVCRYG